MTAKIDLLDGNPLRYSWTFTLAQGEVNYFAPPIPENFNGYASMQYLRTSGQITVQIESNNTENAANWMVPYDADNVLYQPVATALATSKFFGQVIIPAAVRNRFKVTESSGTAQAVGVLILYLKRT
jgi:hypothetical protein